MLAACPTYLTLLDLISLVPFLTKCLNYEAYYAIFSVLLLPFSLVRILFLLYNTGSEYCSNFIACSRSLPIINVIQNILSWQKVLLGNNMQWMYSGRCVSEYRPQVVQLIFLSRWYLEHGLLDKWTCRHDELPILTWSPTFASCVIWYSCQRNVFINCFKMW